MKAIVYRSNAGHAKRYAELFSQMTLLPVYELGEAHKKISKGDEIIFFGWLCAGTLPGYKKAAKRYLVRGLCAVGMGRPDEKQISEVANKYGFARENAFYLQGGFDIAKLHGIYKFMMNTANGFAGKELEQKTQKTEEELEMLAMLKDGGDFVSEENLSPVLIWYKTKSK